MASLKPQGFAGGEALLRGSESVDRERGQRKGATSKSVKSRQEYFRHFSTFFAQGKKRQKSSKSVQNVFSTLFDHFRAAPVFRPLWGGSDRRVFRR